MLLICICSYLKSGLRYKCLILDTCCLDTLYLCEQAYEDVWLFFEAKRGPQAKKFGKHCHMLVIFTVVCQAVGKAWCGKGMFLC